MRFRNAKVASSIPASGTNKDKAYRDVGLFLFYTGVTNTPICPCSSVVEHSLGKGEVGSSILPMGTNKKSAEAGQASSLAHSGACVAR